MNNKDVALAADFICVLAGNIYIVFNCGKCDNFPTKPNKWLRCTNKAMADKKGGTTEGGHWRCSRELCMERWGWSSDGSKRILLVTKVAEGDKPPNGDSVEFEIAYIGEVTLQQEHTITLLKSAQLCKAVKDEQGD